MSRVNRQATVYPFSTESSPTTPMERAFAAGGQQKRRAEAIRIREVVRYPDGTVAERVREHLVVDYLDAPLQLNRPTGGGGAVLKLMASAGLFVLMSLGFTYVGGGVGWWWLGLFLVLAYVWRD